MALSYVLLRAKQLLFETFLFSVFSFRDIGLDHLTWDTRCVYVCVRARVCVYMIIYRKFFVISLNLTFCKKSNAKLIFLIIIYLLIIIVIIFISNFYKRKKHEHT